MAALSSLSSSSSSSLTASMLPPMGGMCAEWTIDRRPIQTAVFNAIGRTAEKLDGLLPPLVSLVVDYLEERGGFFGEKEWADHFGRIPLDAVTRQSIHTAVFDTIGITTTQSTDLFFPLVDLVVDYLAPLDSVVGCLVPPAPALPPRIEEIWQSPCPIYRGKKIKETHMFVYIPATVNGHPLTLKNLGTLAKQYFPQTVDGYRDIWVDVVEQLGDTPIGNSCWVLMTNEGLPGSGGKRFAEQRNIVATLATKALAAYEVPRTLDAAVCILTRFASSKIRLFSDTYTRCQENVDGYQVVVGGFAPAGFVYYDALRDCDDFVVAALWRFF